MVSLLDINVLVALIWEPHVHHAAASRWFTEIAVQDGWATCPATELGTIRVCARPPAQQEPRETVRELRRLRTAYFARYIWWPDSLSPDGMPEVQTALSAGDVPDRYLLGLARRHHGRLATFDRRLAEAGGESAIWLSGECDGIVAS